MRKRGQSVVEYAVVFTLLMGLLGITLPVVSDTLNSVFCYVNGRVQSVANVSGACNILGGNPHPASGWRQPNRHAHQSATYPDRPRHSAWRQL
jgi:hypothetical protein